MKQDIIREIEVFLCMCIHGKYTRDTLQCLCVTQSYCVFVARIIEVIINWLTFSVSHRMDYSMRMLVLIIHSCGFHFCQENNDHLELRFRVQEEVDSDYLLADLTHHVTRLHLASPLQFRFLLHPSTHHDKLMITASGRIYSTTTLDRDVICGRSEIICELRVDVGVVDTTRSFQVVVVVVELVDVNDNIPTFR